MLVEQSVGNCEPISSLHEISSPSPKLFCFTCGCQLANPAQAQNMERGVILVSFNGILRHLTGAHRHPAPLHPIFAWRNHEA